MKGALSGTTIKDRYVVEECLGQGGIGIVYLARDRQLHYRPVVVKVLAGEWQQDEWIRGKFHHEVEALSRLDHPNIVGVLDHGEIDDGAPFLVMQFIDGLTLEQLINEQDLSVERVLHILRQCCAALSAAHAKGIYHRDLKPQNIMLQKLADTPEVVKVIDFGIAKVMNSIAAPSTKHSITAGTLLYMAPEQIRGEDVTAATDIWSLGVITYEMITGHRPFKARSPIELLEKQKAGIRISPQALRNDVPSDLNSAILRCLKFEPADRFQSAVELSGDASAAGGLKKQPSGSDPETRHLSIAQSITPNRNRIWKALTALLGITVLVTTALYIRSMHNSASLPASQVNQNFVPAVRTIWAFERAPILAARFSPTGGGFFASVKRGNGRVTHFVKNTERYTQDMIEIGAGLVADTSRYGLLLSRSDGTLVRCNREGKEVKDITRINIGDYSGQGAGLDDSGQVFVVRQRGKVTYINYPIDHEIYHAEADISFARISPSGDWIAFRERESSLNYSIVLLNTRSSRAKKYPIRNVEGISWRSKEDGIWFVGADLSSGYPFTPNGLFTMSLAGAIKKVADMDSPGKILDIGSDGRVLMVVDGDDSGETYGLLRGDNSERLISAGQSTDMILAKDGETLILQNDHGTYFLDSTKGLLTRVGEESSDWIMPIRENTREVLVTENRISASHVRLLGIGKPHSSKNLPLNFWHIGWAAFGKDGHLLVEGTPSASSTWGIYSSDPLTSDLKQLGPESSVPVLPPSPDGRWLLASDMQAYFLISVADGSTKPLPKVDFALLPIQWLPDGLSVYAYENDKCPTKVYICNLQTGEKVLWRTLPPPEVLSEGVVLTSLVVSPDGRYYAYSVSKKEQDLYLMQLVDGGSVDRAPARP